MAEILSSKKIFVDTKEEISFVAERVLGPQEEKIILIIPQNSLIFSSLVSLNILYRLAAEKNKLIILVTEDEYGIKIAQKAGYIVVNKVSQISSDLWSMAKKREQQLSSLIKEKRSRLINDMKPMEDASTLEIPDEFKKSPIIEETIKEEELINPKEEIVEEVQTNEILPSHKPVIEPKVVEVEGIQIFAGGDVSNFINTHDDDKITATSENRLEGILNNEHKPMAGNNFAGRDLTRQVSKKSGLSALFSKFTFKKSSSESRENLRNLGLQVDKLRKPRNYKKLAAILLIVFAVLAGGFYWLIFNSSSVEIKVTLKQESVSASDTIKGDTVATTIDNSTLTIPAILVKKDKLSLSKTGTADGQSQNGEKAKGLITIYNKTDREITLPVGTKITSVATSLNYLLTKDITLDKGTVGSEPGVDNASVVHDVAIEAETFGEKYNVTDSSSNTVFTIQGFEGVQDVEGKRFDPIEGGTTVSFTSVSADNIKTLKEKITPDLEKQGKTAIAAVVPSGYRLITDSIQFKETKTTSLPELDAKAEDKTFTLTVEGEVTGIAVKEEDLKSIVNYIVSKQNGSNEVNITDIGNIDLTNVTRTNDTEASFTIASKGTVTQTMSKEDLTNLIKGKTYKEAQNLLSQESNIEEFKIAYSPFFIPNMLRFIPKDASRISFTIQ